MCKDFFTSPLTKLKATELLAAEGKYSNEKGKI